MSKRFDNRRLLIVLGALIVLLLVTIVIKIPRQRATIKETLIDMDTAAVERIVFVPKTGSGKEFEFTKQNNKWTVRQGDITAEPAKNAVENIYSEILGIKPQSLAAVNRSEWKKYELTDSLATTIKFFGKSNKQLAGLMIGTFSYRQVNSPYPNMGNNIEGTSFVRLTDEEKVYSVEGFLPFSLSGNFNDWRDRSFLRCKKEDITKIRFTLPADSSFIIEKRDSVWYAGGERADSSQMAGYLNSLTYQAGDQFKDGFSPSASPRYQMNIEGNNLLNVTVKCFSEEGKDEYVFNSSQNPSVFFSGKRSEMFSKLFKAKGYFRKAEEKKR